MLTIHKFQKYYGSQRILEIAELTLPPGIHWIKGKNGSGKTTFFKSLAGLIPFAGEVALDKLSLKRDPVDYRMRVNYGEAEPLYPEFLTAYDLIHFVGKAKKASQQQTSDLIAALQMQDFLHNPCGTYSSGMLKKLSLALAFLGTPQVIMLDEPLITIDEQAVACVYELIQQYRQQDVTFLLSSHQDFDFGVLPTDTVFLVHDQTITQEA